MNNRESKAQRITDEQIKNIDSYSYKVKSQTSDKWYDVISTESGFVCSCPDSKFRKFTCKHKIALEISLQIRKRVEETKKEQVIVNPVEINGCKFCESDNIIRLTDGDLPQYQDLVEIRLRGKTLHCTHCDVKDCRHIDASWNDEFIRDKLVKKGLSL